MVSAGGIPIWSHIEISEYFTKKARRDEYGSFVFGLPLRLCVSFFFCLPATAASRFVALG
jgi:hypothetical protein